MNTVSILTSQPHVSWCNYKEAGIGQSRLQKWLRFQQPKLEEKMLG